MHWTRLKFTCSMEESWTGKVVLPIIGFGFFFVEQVGRSKGFCCCSKPKIVIMFTTAVRPYVCRVWHNPNVPFHLKMRNLQLHGFPHLRKSVLQLCLVWFVGFFLNNVKFKFEMDLISVYAGKRNGR